MTVGDEDSSCRNSDITLRVANRYAHGNSMPPRAGIPPNFGRTRSDREISAYVQKIDQRKDDPKKQIEYLSKLRALLQQKVQQQQVAELGSVLGPPVVDAMRNYPENEELIEECTCILYLLSILDPTFKKGVARLFKAMEDHRDNVAIQRAACAAIRRVISKNPDAIPRIVPSVNVILRSMTEHGANGKFICSALEVLAIIASNIPAKPIFVYRDGALNHVLAAMKQYPNDLSIQATALRTLSNLSYGSGEDILESFGPTITAVIRAMKRHIMHNKVQLYGCCTLHYISEAYKKEITEAWGISTILLAMKEYAHDIMLQEQGCGALSIILNEKIDSDIESFIKEGGLNTILQSMMQSPQNLEIQKYGLKILNSLKTKDNYELMLSGGGLDVIISDMNSFDYQVDIAMQCCEILKNFTRMSLDFQRAVSAKGGIGLVLTTMRRHVNSHSVQDSGFACMRNICLHRDNLTLVEGDGGVGTLLTHMAIYLEDAAIQAYGCDALGRLATETKNLVTIVDDNGIGEVLRAMKEHPGHPGVQDRACFFLLAMTEYPPAVISMREKDVLSVVREARGRVPPKEVAKQRLETLISRLEKEGGTGWFKLKS
mmetsp:Transcript_31949/g.75150  ORF Transcript_31949/g.75150 Transcript_31949/m.75150 type:complete len:602 (-) Transcript_31949:183-1988(-)|eukprot:CAMPEP_0172395082 /NCGR_PEP_ID=MMETSP1061-20121228/18009_1 /TAXON_ID=37318 /ORGANISM="Pseudo-nitzschia pungens, Strain cf. pungens" /LENGTH=601 /DNA_ID=CAMNT_0013126565 /DNA_START=175 /DNA_END=1980 /DNA_ORIENTATION=-